MQLSAVGYSPDSIPDCHGISSTNTCISLPVLYLVFILSLTCWKLLFPASYLDWHVGSYCFWLHT